MPPKTIYCISHSFFQHNSYIKFATARAGNVIGGGDWSKDRLIPEVINSIQNNVLDKKIITITSPSPGNGKSTISMKLAEGIAKIGKKVLLVDNDLKRGNIAKNYNIKSISEKTFNSIG